MKTILMNSIRRIISAFSNTRGEFRFPEKPSGTKNHQKAEEQNRVVIPVSMKIEGKEYGVNAVFDRESKETALDKLKYLLGFGTKK